MNGTSQSNGADPRASTQRIHRALEIVYNARSTNSERENATQYLEALKSDQRASCYGFELASTRTQPTVVRYFGLSLIDHTIRFRWSEYGQEESKALRDWTLRLAHNTSSEDPAFITNKVAEIWVELAKRSWALDWTNLDENLVQLWAGDTAQRNLVLVILTTLSEEIFTIEDTVVALRDTELNKACVDIFTPLDTLTRNFPNRENKTDLRHGSEGWVARMANALTSCMVNGRVPDGYTETVLKILYTYKSIVNWIIPNALVVTNSLAPVFSCLEVGNVAIQLVSHALTL